MFSAIRAAASSRWRASGQLSRVSGIGASCVSAVEVPAPLPVAGAARWVHRRIPSLDGIITTSNSTMFQREDVARHELMNMQNVDETTVLQDHPGLHRDPGSEVEWDLFPSPDYAKDYFVRERLFHGPQHVHEEAHVDPPISSLFPGTDPHLTDFEAERRMIQEYNMAGPDPTEPAFRGVDADFRNTKETIADGVHWRGTVEEVD